MFLGTNRLKLSQSRLVPGDQAIQVVAIRAVRPKLAFIEQPLNAATETHLVGVILSAHRPTHLAVPTPPQDYHSGTC